MKFSNLLSILTLASVAASVSLPALAQPYTPSSHTGHFISRNSSQVSQEFVHRPDSVAMELAVIFPSTLRLDVDASQNYPMTLVLAQTLTDTQGNIVAPAQSPVRASIQAVDGGVQITAESIVVSGRSIPVKAVSSVIPSHAVTQQNGIQRGSQHAHVGVALGDGISGVFGADQDTSFRIASGLKVIGFLNGASSPKQTREVTIPEGSLHLMKVQRF